MSYLSAIARGRVRAEDMMVDTCEVREPSVDGEFDPATGETAVVPGALVYSGKVKIQNTDAVYERASDAGGHQFIVQRYSLHFPVSAPRIVEDHRVTITGSLVSPHNVGRVFRVASPSEKTFSTAQRVNADELTGRVQGG